MTKRFYVLMAVLLVPACSAVYAQAAWDVYPVEGAGADRAEAAEVLPLRRVSLFSSGVGYFEHDGTVDGPADIVLAFPVGAVNDVLKSLVINDPASAFPQVSYPVSDTFSRALGGLKIDLSRNPGIGAILRNLRGEEIEVAAPDRIRGRIVSVENRSPSHAGKGRSSGSEIYVSLATSQGIRVINAGNIVSYSFINPAVNADLDRALNLLMEGRDDKNRNLTVGLDGSGSRLVSLSYVVPQAVWKAAYRLDLSGDLPALQGWAVIDNDSDTDWKGVELSLTAGRPASFVQDLYSPYRVTRPVLPLSIAGTAEARSYGAGVQTAAGKRAAFASRPQMEPAYDDAEAMEPGEYDDAAQAAGAAPSPRANMMMRGVIDTARAAAAGDLFEFTLKNPVTLARRQSAMLPLVEGSVTAVKTLIFSGERAVSSGTINPAAGAELTNTTGMRLPAGPITVYDGKTYAGDALIEFFPEEEKRLISYGEDLSVSGSVKVSFSRTVSAVSVSQGILTVNRKQRHERAYTLHNASGEAKRIVVEHPITAGAVLVEPALAEETTHSLYRFVRELPVKGEFTFTVQEETPVTEQRRLAQFRPETFAAYIADGEIPEDIRAALDGAVKLKAKANEAKAALADIEVKRGRLADDQDRIRRNLEAAGNQTPQGQEYLRRLAGLDAEIDALAALAEEADKNARDAQAAYEGYLSAMEL
jgi:hypothetical protein